MDCNKFQDSISDYLDSALDSRTRAECTAHRLICRECREVYNDVRATLQALNSIEVREMEDPPGLDSRIIARTTAGEMLSCSDFDKLIERYFDGVILAPTFQTFQGHFEKCTKCRRLMVGIEDAISMCREIKESEVEVPSSLHDRIVAATLGVKEEVSGDWSQKVRRARVALINFARSLWTPQMAVAALIFAATTLLILSRFGSVSSMAAQAETQAEILVNQGQRAINQTGAMARTGFQWFSSALDRDRAPDKRKK
jgi:predicted anti-sigma-YlaC factor YlaD